MKKQLQQVDFRDDDEEDDAGLFTHDRCPQCWSSGATTDELPPIDYNVFQKRKKKLRNENISIEFKSYIYT